MTTQIITLSSAKTMNTREIAELVEARIDSVKRTIDRLVERGVITQPPTVDVPFVDEAGRNRTVSVYVFSGEQGKRDSIVVVAQLSPEFTGRLVDRWQELEASATTAPPPVPVAMLPSQVGKQVILDMMEVATLFGAPKSYAIQVAASEAVRQTGMPWDRLLTQAAAMCDVPHEDVLLEPTELGKMFELSGVKMNRWLADHGLQARVAGEWKPTDAGSPLCQRHAWVRGDKSGYNLKWRAAEIERMMDQDLASA